ncbi:sensor histidine kinase [Streptomyces sp. NPDC046860]|uniref:sensor histidine kinase n=1 Tax=Streptomyces sp. NPDC046860 TaxID=3154495 RepID=UPI0033E46B40
MSVTLLGRGAGRLQLRLRLLREDLLTFRSDPLPAFVWLRWLPHGLLCLAAFGIGFGGVAQLMDNAGLQPGAAFVAGLAPGVAVVIALRWPLAAWWLSSAAVVAGAAGIHARLADGTGRGGVIWPWTAAGIIAHLIVLLLLALRVPTRVALEALAVTVLYTFLLEGVWGAGPHQSTGVVAVVLSVVVVVLGTALRGRRVARAQLVEQTSLTEEERSRRTLLEERGRIARELHDVVAHHMSVISIQAQVAPHLVANPTDELRENLEGIRTNALEALTELRRVLGVLRSEVPDVSDTPQPDLGRLEDLFENIRAAGLTVTARFRGERRPYPPGVELSAYRILQEALSNALRHAPGSVVRVEVECLDDGISLDVVDSGADGPVRSSPGSGHGLLGMRERAAMLGGRLTAGPTGAGGFRVTAFLPETDSAAHPFSSRQEH